MVGNTLWVLEGMAKNSEETGRCPKWLNY